MRELPPGWTYATVADLIASDGIFSDGDWVESKDQDPTGAIRLLQLADVGDGVFVDKSNRFVNDDKFGQLRCTEVFDGDVLIARMPDPLGRACLAPKLRQRCITVVDVAIVRPGPTSVRPRWLMHFLNAPPVRQVIELQSSGTTRRRISRGNLAQLELPVPPLIEQKRIADKLDALLARVDACRERLDRVPTILKRFRQSALAAATNGELTKEWREARDRDLAGWETTTVAALLLGKPRNGYSPRAVERPTAVKSLTLTATTTGIFRGEHSKYIDEEIPPNSHLWLAPGDILIQRANTLEYVGVSAVFDGPGETFIYPDLMMKCRANARVVTPFLHYVLSSEPVRSFFRKNATGTAGNMPKINQQTVLGAPALVPPIDEQHEIVRRMEALLPIADLLERRCNASRKLVDKLTPSMLAKAFRGELVPQDPDDEPASDLLARIRGGAAAPTASGKPKRGGARGLRTKAKAETDMLTRKDIKPSHLTTILKERGALTAEALWTASQLEIDEFYDQLKDEEAQGLLHENRGDSPTSPRLLEAAA